MDRSRDRGAEGGIRGSELKVQERRRRGTEGSAIGDRVSYTCPAPFSVPLRLCGSSSLNRPVQGALPESTGRGAETGIMYALHFGQRVFQFPSSSPGGIQSLEPILIFSGAPLSSY